MLKPFPERYHTALADPQLQRNLLVFQRNWEIARDRNLRERGIDFDAERALLKSMKDEVIRNLPEYLDRFTSAVESAGGRVVSAATADEATRYIAELARSRGIHQIVKSKSMVSEEIELNEGLESAGLHVVETDLGEWLVQLAGERPSHIIAPAIHKNRFQIADLLTQHSGRTVPGEDIGGQVSVARESLREEFLAGQMGISGANALVAETGTVMLVTNEGNAELVTSIPPVHVVLVGMEKIVPTLEDAFSVLELLVPSATGQQSSAYVSWITGPTAPGQELHVILLDNGRSAMRASPLYQDALRCIRCGACSNICPSYGVVGGHVFGYIYSGAIGLVNTPFHNGIENDIGPQSLCVQCNACQRVCPVDIPLPEQILGNRAWAVREGSMSWPERAVLEIWSRRHVFELAARAGAVLQKPIKRGPFVEPPLAKKLTSWRKLPALADRPFRASWSGTPPPALPGELGETLRGVTVAYFVQCLTDWLYPEMGHAIVDLLGGLGARVVFPRTQHCCGLPAIDSGKPDLGRRMARQTIETLEQCRADYVVSGGTSCVIAALHEYPGLFAEQPEWQMRGRALAERFYDVTSFLDRVVRLPAGSLSDGSGPTGTYHYFCQSYNVLGFREEPLRLLSEVCGLDTVPLPEANWCCGFGGSTSLNRPETSERILARKLANVDASGASLLVTDNPGCIMHLRGGIAASGRDVRVKHTAEVVAERVRALRTR